jgi:hypothetical protein
MVNKWLTRVEIRTERGTYDGFRRQIAAHGDASAPEGQKSRRNKCEARSHQFLEKIPEVVSWYVMMGVGQVVTLSLPPGKLREVNLAIEQCAWGAFDTEFYPTYDFVPIWQGLQAKHSGG